MKRVAISLALATSLAFTHEASADPLVLRGPDLGPSVGLAVGVPDSSFGGWITPRFGLALEWRAPSAIGASAGTRFTLVGRPRGGGIDVQGALGFQLLRYDPGAAITATIAIQARYRSEGFWFSAGLASPSALQLIGGIEARLPLMLELALAGRLGRIWIGAQGGAGLVFVPGLSPSLAIQGTITATIPIGS